jgi:hypothetical protein
VFSTIAYRGEGCVYCTQRNLVVLGPILALCIVAGLVALARQGLWAKGAALAGVIMLLGTGAASASTIVRRADEGGYALPTAATRVADGLEGRRGAVLLEGANASYLAVHELPALYYAVRERTAGPIWLDDEHDDHQGLWTFGPTGTDEITFRRRYRWVVTRLPAIESDRITILRHGAFALQRRILPTDVTVLSGVAARSGSDDAAGRAWVEGPLIFRVSTLRPERLVLRLTVASRVPVTLLGPADGRLRRTGTGRWEACVPLGRLRARRDVQVGLGFPSTGPLADDSRLALKPRPETRVELTGMHVGARC